MTVWGQSRQDRSWNNMEQGWVGGFYIKENNKIQWETSYHKVNIDMVLVQLVVSERRKAKSLNGNTPAHKPKS